MRRTRPHGRPNRYRLPLEPALGRKFDALGRRTRLRVLGAAPRGTPVGDETFTLQRGRRSPALDAPAFYGALPLRVARELRREPADAILAQSPYEALAAFAGRALARSDSAVVVEIHGDWRTWARVYGSPARAVVAPLADRAALIAVRHADAVRTLSAFTTRMARSAGVEPTGTFTTYTDLTAFSEPPVRRSPPARRALRRCPRALQEHPRDRGRVASRSTARAAATLHLVGDGRTATCRRAGPRPPGSVTWEPRLETPAVVRRSTTRGCCCSPRAPRAARVVLEALCRGRAVVGARAGGSRTSSGPSETGLLVDPERPDEIADALVRILSDRALAERLGDGPTRTRRTGRTRRTSTPSEWPSSSRAPWRPAREARRRDPAGRPGEPGARRDGRQARRARRPCRRARRPGRLRRRGRAARELPRASLPLGSPRRSRAPLRVALARELARRPKPAAVLAHMCPIYAVLAAPIARRSGSTCCSGSRTGAGAGCSGPPSGSRPAC